MDAAERHLVYAICERRFKYLAEQISDRADLAFCEQHHAEIRHAVQELEKLCDLLPKFSE